jgi:hypothetical protein
MKEGSYLCVFRISYKARWFALPAALGGEDVMYLGGIAMEKGQKKHTHTQTSEGTHQSFLFRNGAVE